jgi:hypothetical protein
MSTVASWGYSLVGCAPGDVFPFVEVTEFFFLSIDTRQSLHAYSTSAMYLRYMYLYKPRLDLPTRTLFVYYLLIWFIKPCVRPYEFQPRSLEPVQKMISRVAPQDG